MELCEQAENQRLLDIERINDEHDVKIAKQRMDGESTQTDMRAQGTRSSTLTKLLADIEAAKHRREQDAKDNTPAPSTSHQPPQKAAATHKRVVQSSNGEHTTTSIIEQNFGGGGAAPSRVAKAIGKKIDPKKQAEETRQKEQQAKDLKAQEFKKQMRAKEIDKSNRPVNDRDVASTSAPTPNVQETWVDHAATSFNWALKQAQKVFEGSKPTMGQNLQQTQAHDQGIDVPLKEPINVDPSEIGFSQATISYKKYRRDENSQKVSYTYDDIVASMIADGWNGAPLNVVQMPDGNLTTIDNTRLLAAKEAGIKAKIVIHKFNDAISDNLANEYARPNMAAPKTWHEAIQSRIDDQKTKFFQDRTFPERFSDGSIYDPKITGKR